MEIIPAIIPRSCADIDAAVLKMTAIAPMLQIDITDGIFAGTPSWPYTDNATVKDFPSGIQYEIDIMAEDPLPLAHQCVKAGARRIILHVETIPDLATYIERFRKDSGEAELYLALNIETPHEILEPIGDKIDGIECMGIATIGSQGEPFDERVLDKIKGLHSTYPTLPISVDGGMNAETITLVKSAGATRAVVGSAIFGAPNPVEAFKAFSAL